MKSFLLIFSLIIITSSISVPSVSEVMDYIETTINNRIEIKTIKVWAMQDFWVHELKPSVSLYLFEDINMVENIAPEGNPNRPGDKHEKKYITVHDTGDFAFNAKQWSQHVHDAKIGNTTYNLSFQYVVGDDGYYHNIPDDEAAYHAGDGSSSESYFEEYETGVYGDNENPHISISTDGYYTIDGKKTKILAPTDEKGNILNEEYFNDQGIYTSIKNGMYYIGNTWYSDVHKRIGNHGGNTHSIGIESCVNRGSDIYFTIQRLAKLVAKLLDENNFTMKQIAQHHYYSGKDCPQTMRTEGYWKHFLKLVEVESQMLQYRKMGFTFKLNPLFEKYMNDVGRILDRPLYFPIDVSYEITVSGPEGDSLTKTFSSTIPSKFGFENK